MRGAEVFNDRDLDIVAETVLVYGESSQYKFTAASLIEWSVCTEPALAAA